MSSPTISDLRDYVIGCMEAELQAIEAGKRRLDGSCQFDDVMLKSAIQTCTADKWAKVVSTLTDMGVKMLPVMSWAYWLSDFQPDDIEGAWLD